MADQKGLIMNDFMSRAVADALDRDGWLAHRTGRIGASDAANFAKLESRDKYVRAMLGSPFGGNAYTATGNRWEEPALAAVGIARNTLMFRSVDEDGFVATPDGIVETPGGLVLAEAKAKLVKPHEPFDPETWMPRIPPTHQRQMWWAQFVLGAEFTRYVVLPYDERHTPLLMQPRIINFDRDDEQIARLIAIATPVLAALRAAAEFERTAS